MKASSLPLPPSLPPATIGIPSKDGLKMPEPMMYAERIAVLETQVAELHNTVLRIEEKLDILLNESVQFKQSFSIASWLTKGVFVTIVTIGGWLNWDAIIQTLAHSPSKH
jgi:hypothetical protein